MSIHIKIDYFCPYCGQKHGRTIRRPPMPGENLGDQVRGATKICIMCSDFYHKSKDYFNEKHKRSVFNKIVNTILLRAKKAYWDNMEAAVFEWVYKGGLPKKHNAWLLVEILFRATDDLINNQVFKPPIKCKYSEINFTHYLRVMALHAETLNHYYKQNYADTSDAMESYTEMVFGKYYKYLCFYLENHDKEFTTDVLLNSAAEIFFDSYHDELENIQNDRFELVTCMVFGDYHNSQLASWSKAMNGLIVGEK